MNRKFINAQHLKISLFLMSVFFLTACSRDSKNIQNEEPKRRDFLEFKVYTDMLGAYEITEKEFAELEINRDFINENIEIINQGKSIPFWIDEIEGKRTIKWIAEKSGSKYSKQNIYFFSIKSKPKYKPETSGDFLNNPFGTLSIPLRSNRITQAEFILEENLMYQPQVDTGDHWLWSSLAAPGEATYEFTLKNMVDNPSMIHLRLWASTESSESYDHSLTIKVNEVEIATEKWDGRGTKNFKIEIPPGIIREGNNRISLHAPGLPSVPVDILWIDQIKVLYAKNLFPENSFLDFYSQGQEIPLEKFSGPIDIYDVTSSSEPVRIAQSLDNNQKWSGTSDHHYWLVGEDGYQKPNKIEKAETSPDLLANQLSVDYLVIGPKDLLEPLEPLLLQRKKQGLNTLAISIQSIYDQFNSGLPEPIAVRNFLRFSKENWISSPRYVLLVGDTSYDPLGYISPIDANQFPSFFINTTYGGETVSDIGFAELDGVLWPDLEAGFSMAHPEIAVGRIPAKTVDQVRTIVKKIIDYENDENDIEAPSRITAIADGQSPSFREEAQRFLDYFPTNYTSELFSPDAGTEKPNIDVIKIWGKNNTYIAYFGHGSLLQWGKDRIFSTEDITELKITQNLPIVLNFTCLTGLFSHPRVESLSEALLWKPDVGAVAVLAPTSLTLPSDQSYLSKALADGINDSDGKRLGDVILEAWNQIPVDSSGGREVLWTFLLLGDPGLLLK